MKTFKSWKLRRTGYVALSSLLLPSTRLWVCFLDLEKVVGLFQEFSVSHIGYLGARNESEREGGTEGGLVLSRSFVSFSLSTSSY
jgi:hypothetical protein